MEPPIGESVGLVSPGNWSIGTFMSCEELQGQSPPEDAVAHWNDGDSTFCLRPRLPTTSPSGDSAVGKFYDRATCHAAWNLSPNIICKCTSWTEGMEVEGTTIEFVVKNAPSVPVPEVIYYWIDPTWERVFTIVRRVQGVRFNEAWFSLSEEQRVDVAAQLAKHAVTLSKLTSSRCEKPSGAGVTYSGDLFGGLPRERGVIWRVPLHSPATAEELTAIMAKLYGAPPPDMGKCFIFAHTDMSPTNVFVHMPTEETGHVQLSAIIDWETAGFYPHWYPSTNARITRGFGLDDEFLDEPPPGQWDWLRILSDALIEEGFRCEQRWYMQVMGMEISEEVDAKPRARDERQAPKKQGAAEKQETAAQQEAA